MTETTRHKKQTAITAGLAQKAKEHNDMVDMASPRKTVHPDMVLAMARISKAMKLCDEHGIDFDQLVRNLRNAQKDASDD